MYRDKLMSPAYGRSSDSEEQVLSGDFINDGDYTQPSPNAETGISMYHNLHRLVSFLIN